MIVFEANYSKKLGLPGYSSHQYSVTIRTELADIHQVNEQSQQIHALLQSAVDREIQKTGYLPLPTQGQAEPPQNNGNNKNVNHGAHFNRNGNGYRQRQHVNRNGGFRNTPRFEQWKCSPKQQELILKLVNEHQLDKQHVEHLSMQLFGIGVKALNKLQASGLIDELISQQEQGNGSPQPTMAGGAR